MVWIVPVRAVSASVPGEGSGGGVTTREAYFPAEIPIMKKMVA